LILLVGVASVYQQWLFKMFETYNEAGALQFNATSYAYSFVSKGTITISNSFTIAEDGGDGFYLATGGSVYIPGGWDIIVFSSPNVAIIPRADTFAGVANYFSVFADALYDGPDLRPSSYSVTANYWVFKSSRTALSPASNGVGMELYNADGTVCYSSTQKPLLVKNNAIITSFSTGWTGSINLPSGPTYAHMLYGTVKSGNFQPGIKTRADGWDGKACVRYAGTFTNVVAGGILSVDVSGY
jgi:hypothetical protein